MCLGHKSSKVMMASFKLCFLSLQVLSNILVSLAVLSDVQVEVLGETKIKVISHGEGFVHQVEMEEV